MSPDNTSAGAALEGCITTSRRCLPVGKTTKFAGEIALSPVNRGASVHADPGDDRLLFPELEFGGFVLFTPLTPSSDESMPGEATSLLLVELLVTATLPMPLRPSRPPPKLSARVACLLSSALMLPSRLPLSTPRHADAVLGRRSPLTAFTVWLRP